MDNLRANLMANSIHKLTKKQIDSFSNPGRYNDGGGLYLYVRKGGTKIWTYRFRQDGKLKEMSLGSVSNSNHLRDARSKVINLREQVKAGQNPITEKKKADVIIKQERRADRVFGDVLFEFFESKDKTGHFTSERTRRRWHYSLMVHAKKLHMLSIKHIKTSDVYKVLEPIWISKTETASRTRLYIEAVMSWAKTMGYREGENPAVWRGNLDQLLAPKNRVSPVRHHPGMAWQDIPEFFSKLRDMEMPAARLLEFIILTASRSGEARGALWSEINLDKMVWEIPAARMKMKRPHLVPIQGRLVSLIKEARINRMNELVFPNMKTGREYSYNAPMVVMKRLEVYDLTVHGFRSSFKTWALENTSFPTQAVEFALSHETRNAVEGAYIRGNRMLEKRRDIMAAWDKYCL